MFLSHDYICTAKAYHRITKIPTETMNYYIATQIDFNDNLSMYKMVKSSSPFWPYLFMFIVILTLLNKVLVTFIQQTVGLQGSRYQTLSWTIQSLQFTACACLWIMVRTLHTQKKTDCLTQRYPPCHPLTVNDLITLQVLICF